MIDQVRSTTTPHLDSLTDQEQIFVLALFNGANPSRAAVKAGYNRRQGPRLGPEPRIKAALLEQQKLAQVHSDPTRVEIIGWLAFEAQNLLNPATVRVQAMKTLADIKGMTKGGGNEGDSALDEFFRRAGRAVTSGVFDGLKQAGRKLGAGDAVDPTTCEHRWRMTDVKTCTLCGFTEGEDAGAREGEVVEPGDVDLGAAFEVPAVEVE